MTALIFALVLATLSFASFIAFIVIDEKNNELKGFIFTLTVLLMVSNSILIAATASILKDTPTAMDVYQDKTTLKYTIVDSTIVDSTVIFKEDW